MSNVNKSSLGNLLNLEVDDESLIEELHDAFKTFSSCPSGNIKRVTIDFPSLSEAGHLDKLFDIFEMNEGEKNWLLSISPQKIQVDFVSN